MTSFNIISICVLFMLYTVLPIIQADSMNATEVAASPWIEALGSTLYRWKSVSADEIEIEELPTEELLKNKRVIGLYFSKLCHIIISMLY